MKLGQKGLIQWIALLILAVALPAVLYLSQKTQIFKPRADVDCPDDLYYWDQSQNSCIHKYGGYLDGGTGECVYNFNPGNPPGGACPGAPNVPTATPVPSCPGGCPNLNQYCEGNQTYQCTGGYCAPNNPNAASDGCVRTCNSISGNPLSCGGATPTSTPTPQGGGTGTVQSVTLVVSDRGRTNVPVGFAAIAWGDTGLRQLQVWVRKSTDSANSGNLVGQSPSCVPSGSQDFLRCQIDSGTWTPTQVGPYVMYTKVLGGSDTVLCGENGCPAGNASLPNQTGVYTSKQIDIVTNKFSLGNPPATRGHTTGGFNISSVNCVEDPNGRYSSLYDCAKDVPIYCCGGPNQCQPIPNQYIAGGACYFFLDPGGLDTEWLSCGPRTCGGAGTGYSATQSQPPAGTSGVPIYSSVTSTGGQGCVAGQPGCVNPTAVTCPDGVIFTPRTPNGYTGASDTTCGYSYNPSTGQTQYVKFRGVSWKVGADVGVPAFNGGNPDCAPAHSWKVEVDGQTLTAPAGAPTGTNGCYNNPLAPFAVKNFDPNEPTRSHTFKVTAFSDNKCDGIVVGTPSTQSIDIGPACDNVTTPITESTRLYPCEFNNQCTQGFPRTDTANYRGGYVSQDACRQNCVYVPPPVPTTQPVSNGCVLGPQTGSSTTLTAGQSGTYLALVSYPGAGYNTRNPNCNASGYPCAWVISYRNPATNQVTNLPPIPTTSDTFTFGENPPGSRPAGIYTLYFGQANTTPPTVCSIDITVGTVVTPTPSPTPTPPVTRPVSYRVANVTSTSLCTHAALLSAMSTAAAWNSTTNSLDVPWDLLDPLRGNYNQSSEAKFVCAGFYDSAGRELSVNSLVSAQINYRPVSTPTPTPTTGATGCCQLNTNTCSVSCTARLDRHPVGSKIRRANGTELLIEYGVGGNRDNITCAPTSVSYNVEPNENQKNTFCDRGRRTKGDADGDNVVNEIDYFYRVRGGGGGPLPPNVNPDFNGNGHVGSDDLIIWQLEKGVTPR